MTLNYVTDIKDEKLSELIKLLLLEETEIIALDTETTGLDPFTSELLLVQIGIGSNIYVLNRGKVGKNFISKLIALINSRGITCIGHNIKFDIKMLKVDTNLWISKVYDTMTIEAVLTAGIGEKLTSLRTLVNKYCKVYLEKDTRKEFLSMHQDSDFSEQQITYAATDILYLFDIYYSQIKTARETNLIRTVELENKLLPVVADMEYQGIPLDREHWKILVEKARIQVAEYEVKIKDSILSKIKTSPYKNALEFADALQIKEGAKTKRDRTALESITDTDVIKPWIRDNFNLGSPQQLKTALNLIGIKTSSTNEKIINKLKKNEVIDLIIEYRGFKKQAESYGDNIIELINPVTQRIHTEYFPVGALARFSSSNPNLQNMPRKGGYREGFVARPGFSFMAMDYSQQEFRLAGSTSGEPKIIEAYIRGSDMHTATATIRFKKKLEDITSEERNTGKTMNFAILYGTTAWGLKRNFNISLEEAQEMLDEFYEGYPRLTKYMLAAQERIIELGYSVTLLGRRRYFNPLPVFGTPHEIEKIKAQQKREGYNFIIQGTAADVTKLAMIDLWYNNPFGDKFKPLLQVHDEVVAEVEDSIIESAKEYMAYTMKEVFKPFLGKIPAEVEGKVSKRWTK